MFERRIVDPSSVYVEQPAIDKADEFVHGTPELSSMPEEYRDRTIDRVARMITAIEVSLFDAPSNTSQGVSLTCVVETLDEEAELFEEEDGEDMRIIFVMGEKVDNAVVTEPLWLTEREFETLETEIIN